MKKVVKGGWEQFGSKAGGGGRGIALAKEGVDCVHGTADGELGLWDPKCCPICDIAVPRHGTAEGGLGLWDSACCPRHSSSEVKISARLGWRGARRHAS